MIMIKIILQAKELERCQLFDKYCEVRNIDRWKVKPEDEFTLTHRDLDDIDPTEEQLYSLLMLS